jgi:hypothetical protein
MSETTQDKGMCPIPQPNEQTKQQDDDHTLGLKLFDLFCMLEKVNEDNKKNARKRELLKSI